MKWILESSNIYDYLKEDSYIDYNDLMIKKKTKELFLSFNDEKSKIKSAFEFVRDQISHSWDINSERVTKKASEVLKYREGICIAKSLLLAALLRSENIPTGLCYQRLTLGDTPDTDYIIHGLNAVYLSEEKRWIRLDARGNKENVNAQFSINEEKIAFPVRAEYDEIDYPTIYAKMPETVVNAMKNYNNRKTDEYNLSEL